MAKKSKTVEPSIPEVLTSLTPADAEEIHSELGRPWTDINLCILAFQADNTAHQIASLDVKDIRVLLLLGADTPELAPLQSVLDEVATRYGDDPFTVKAEAIRHLKGTAEAGGDYLTFISFIEFLMRRKDEPELEWSLFRAGVSSIETAMAFVGRFEKQTLESHKAMAKDVLDGKPQPKGKGGNPLQQQSE